MMMMMMTTTMIVCLDQNNDKQNDYHHHTIIMKNSNIPNDDQIIIESPSLETSATTIINHNINSIVATESYSSSSFDHVDHNKWKNISLIQRSHRSLLSW